MCSSDLKFTDAYPEQLEMHKVIIQQNAEKIAMKKQARYIKFLDKESRRPLTEDELEIKQMFHRELFPHKYV